MKILALTKYSDAGPSSRYRYYNYQKPFEEYGIEMDIAPLFPTEYLRARGKKEKIAITLRAYWQRILLLLGLLFSRQKYALLIVEYEMLPYMPALFERLLVLRGYKYIVDYDDAIFHRYDLNSNFWIRLFLRKKIAAVISRAAYTIICNEYLGSYARRYTTKIFRIPTVVLLDRYREKTESFTPKGEGFTVGWIGSQSTGVYILELLPAFERFAAAHDDVTIRLVGFDKELLTPEEQKQYHIEAVTWSEEREVDDILSFDVGIMPLHNDPWSKGKCGFKLIQYMSCAKPLIASPVGINVELVDEPRGGYLASNMNEWYEALEKIYSDRTRAEEIGQYNYGRILEDFNHSRETQKYVKLIKDVVAGEKI